MDIKELIEQEAKKFMDSDVEQYDHLLYPDVGAIQRGFIAGANFALSLQQGEEGKQSDTPPLHIDWESAEEDVLMMIRNAHAYNEDTEATAKNIIAAMQAYIGQSKPVAGDGWVKVEDRLPDDNTRTLFINKQGFQIILRYDDFCNTFTTDAGRMYKAIKGIELTHWQPLPSPPIN